MTKHLKIGHTPDADDAFMFYGLTTGAVKIPECEVELILEDIQSLNLRSQRGDLDVTAISAAMYPAIADHYWIMSCGASVGRDYGPVLVSLPDLKLDEYSPQHPVNLKGLRIAVPGYQTTATLLLNIFARNFKTLEVPFDQVIATVKEGRADFGLVIHEGQITFEWHNLSKVLDLGKSWMAEFQLPIPLGLDVIKKDLGRALAQDVNRALKESIRWAQSHRPEAVKFALQFGRGVQSSVLDKFIEMYVNDDTLELGRHGKAALEILFQKAKDLSLIQKIPRVEVIES